MFWLNQVHPKRKDYAQLLAAGATDGDFVLIQVREKEREVVIVGKEASVLPIRATPTERGVYRIDAAILFYDNGGAKCFPCWIDGRASRLSILEKWLQFPEYRWYGISVQAVTSPIDGSTIYTLTTSLFKKDVQKFEADLMSDIELFPDKWEVIKKKP